MDNRSIFVSQVFETALYFREMYEEGNSGMTTAIAWLKPVKSIKNTAVRKFVLDDVYKSRKLPFTEAVFELAKWHPVGGQPPEFEIHDIEVELRERCQAHEQQAKFIDDPEEKIKRSFLRAARHMQRISLNEATAHSRIVELFVPEVFVPKGGSAGAGHREHVIPCAALREESIARIKNGATLEQISGFLRRNVVIVEISKEQQKKLDGSERNGGVGLKDKMPNGWQFDQHCIFARLHKAKITFVPPNGFPNCATNNCSWAHGSN